MVFGLVVVYLTSTTIFDQSSFVGMLNYSNLNFYFEIVLPNHEQIRCDERLDPILSIEPCHHRHKDQLIVFGNLLIDESVIVDLLFPTKTPVFQIMTFSGLL